jgi:hypothetical protein
MYKLTNNKDQSVFIVKSQDESDKKKYWFNWIYAKARAKVEYSNEWRLPSSEELEIMYKELHQENIGDFKSDRYWSADEDSESMANAYSIHMSNGTITPWKKSGLFCVRYVKTIKSGIPSETDSKTNEPKSRGCLGLFALLIALGTSILYAT